MNGVPDRVPGAAADVSRCVAATLGPRLAPAESDAVAAVVSGRRAIRRIYALARGAGTWDALAHDLRDAQEHLERALEAVERERLDQPARAAAGSGLAPPAPRPSSPPDAPAVDHDATPAGRPLGEPARASGTWPTDGADAGPLRHTG